MDVRARRSRETSPDRARLCMQPRVKPLIRKVQVVYYLSRNGQLEHPHYMEVFLSPNHQQLRLKDVMDRITALRGKGMPSLYSWSCKRSYKNGYVWNDLAENDIIYPTEGAEYVLKGSELIEGCTEKFQQLHVISNKQQIPELPNLHPKRKPLTPSRNRETEEVENRVLYETREEEEEEDDDDDDDTDEDEEKTSYTSSNTTDYSRCSRGVSTDEIEKTKKNPTELTLDDHSSPPSTTSSTVSDKANENNISSSKRFEEAVVTESVPNRNSVLLQLIACGSSVGVIKGKKLQCLKQPTSTTIAKKSATTISLRKEVVCKSAAAKEVTEDEIMINCMSMNPRFANLQSEEKEYFSGSIVESMTTEERSCIEPVLKRSNSFNEERSTKTELGEAMEKKEMKREKKAGMKGKCMPRKKSKQSRK